MEYKSQHFITEAYLKAWCDSNTPNGAFVWVVSKKDHSISRKSPSVNMTLSFLSQMNCVVYETNTKPSIITSDNPCFWFDPAIYDPRKQSTFFGIGSPTLNIILPISPKQYISLELNGPTGYKPISPDPKLEDELVDIINGFTATNATEFIVVNQNFYKEKWFEDDK